MTDFFTVAARTLTAGLLIALAGPAAAQQAYPSKPIRIIVAFPPGGGIDIAARLVGQKLTESWGQQVIVDNRPGGNTVIGTEALAKSPPDGYTLLAMSVTHVINALLIPNLPYDSLKDFAPVATLANTASVLVLHPSVPANNLQELIALAKSRPGQLNQASTGSGGVGHLAIELFNIIAGVKMQRVPYKGGVQSIIDLTGGQVQMAIQPPIFVIPHIKSGKLRALAISGEARSPTLPQVPTFTEAGLPGYDVKIWWGVLAAAGTPQPIVDKLSTEIAKILATPDIKEKLDSQGVVPFLSTPDQFAALMKADTAKWARVIKTANIKLDN